MNYKKIIPFVVFVIVFLGHMFHFKIFTTHNSPTWWTSYVQMQLYFVSFSLGLAFAYGAFTLIGMRKFKAQATGATAGSLILAFLIWFTSCCGAPILVVILGILGISVGTVVFPPPLMALLTIVLVSVGYLWLRKRMAFAKLVCASCGSKIEVPVVHCGPGVPGPEEDKLYCPCINEGHTESIDMPEHCQKPMKYVK